MLNSKEVKPEEIALGFLVSTLSSQRKPTTKLGLAKYSLSTYLNSALSKGILDTQCDPATGIVSYCVSADFAEKFSQARATQVLENLRRKRAQGPEEVAAAKAKDNSRELYNDGPERGTSLSGA